VQLLISLEKARERAPRDEINTYQCISVGETKLQSEQGMMQSLNTVRFDQVTQHWILSLLLYISSY